MNWKYITSTQDVDEIVQKSSTKKQAIFKHSTRCSISTLALSRVERFNNNLDIDFYFLDLLKYRDVSNYIADILKVDHQSPQLILIDEGKPIQVQTHHSIDLNELSV